MNKKWMMTLGIPIIALSLMSACSTTNNDNVPNAPQEPSVPKNENTNYNEPYPDSENPDVPSKDMEDKHNQEPGVDDNEGDVGIPEREISRH